MACPIAQKFRNYISCWISKNWKHAFLELSEQKLKIEPETSSQAFDHAPYGAYGSSWWWIKSQCEKRFMACLTVCTTHGRRAARMAGRHTGPAAGERTAAQTAQRLSYPESTSRCQPRCSPRCPLCRTHWRTPHCCPRCSPRLTNQAGLPGRNIKLSSCLVGGAEAKSDKWPAGHRSSLVGIASWSEEWPGRRSSQVKRATCWSLE